MEMWFCCFVSITDGCFQFSFRHLCINWIEQVVYTSVPDKMQSRCLAYPHFKVNFFIWFLRQDKYGDFRLLFVCFGLFNQTNIKRQDDKKGRQKPIEFSYFQNKTKKTIDFQGKPWFIFWQRLISCFPNAIIYCNRSIEYERKCAIVPMRLLNSLWHKNVESTKPINFDWNGKPSIDCVKFDQSNFEHYASNAQLCFKMVDIFNTFAAYQQALFRFMKIN